MSKQRVPNKVLDQLKAVREKATMSKASFGFPVDTVSANHLGRPLIEQHPDQYIKEKTRDYLESWIINPLDEIIAWAEGREI